MTIRRCRATLVVLSAVVVLGLGSAASANHVPSLELEVMIGGASVGTYNEDELGCSSTGGQSFECTGTNLQVGGQDGVNLDSWDLLLDADPVVTGTTALTNLNSSAQQFTLIFTLPTTVSPSSLMGGSLQGGMTDNDGDGVTLSAPTASALYTALIDGVSQQTLYADPSSFSAGMFLSGNVPNIDWGTPIPSAPGPAVLTDIKIKLDFVLTGKDSASLTGNFVVLPIPEPSTALMLGLGLAVLGSRRRNT
jgi:hypothetical protein